MGSLHIYTHIYNIRMAINLRKNVNRLGMSIREMFDVLMFQCH